MGSESYHEPFELLSEEIKELHRAVVSLIEELDAVDWYTQRASVCDDQELRRVLLHHRDEEIEHAMMNLEWLRRNHSKFDEMARRYLFTEKSIVEVEEEAEVSEHAGEAAGSGALPRSLGIGSLKEG